MMRWDTRLGGGERRKSKTHEDVESFQRAKKNQSMNVLWALWVLCTKMPKQRPNTCCCFAIVYP